MRFGLSNLRTLEPSNYRTFGLLDLRTVGPSDCWIFGLSDLWTIGPSYYRTFGLSDLRTIGPSDYRTVTIFWPSITFSKKMKTLQLGKNSYQTLFNLYVVKLKIYIYMYMYNGLKTSLSSIWGLGFPSPV